MLKIKKSIFFIFCITNLFGQEGSREEQFLFSDKCARAFEQINNETNAISWMIREGESIPPILFTYVNMVGASFGRGYNSGFPNVGIFPAEVNNMHALKYLCLYDLNVTNLPSNFDGLSNLKVFRITDDIGLKSLPKFSSSLKLEELRISIKNPDKLKINLENFETIFDLKNLKKLNLTGLYLTDEKVKKMGDLIYLKN